MAQFHATVKVTLKKSVLDPQGKAVQQGLNQLGFEKVNDVRVGKWIELNLDAADAGEAKKKVEAMSDQLLANPIIETFELDVKEA